MMKLLEDLKSAKLIHIKGWLFLILCLLALVGLVTPNFSLTRLALAFIAIWGACRWYYYLFYVIEHYVDPEFKFASISNAIWFLVRKHKTPNK